MLLVPCFLDTSPIILSTKEVHIYWYIDKRISLCACKRLLPYEVGIAKGYDKLVVYKHGRKVTNVECAFLENMEEGLEVMKMDASMMPRVRKVGCCDDILEDYELKFHVDEDRQAERQGRRIIKAAIPQGERPMDKSKSCPEKGRGLGAVSAASIKRKAAQSSMGSVLEREVYQKAKSTRPRINTANRGSERHGSVNECEDEFYVLQK